MKNKKSYLEEKFFSGQETAIKVEAITVAQKMRRSKDEARIRWFTCDEFRTPCHVQSSLSRMASKLRNRQEKVLQEDTTAAENQAADIFDKCQLTHPIAYDSFNLCALNASIMSLSVSIIASLDRCGYFKAPCIGLKTSLVQTCSCAPPITELNDISGCGVPQAHNE